MKIIYTKKREEIFVDDEDFEYLNQFKWHINISRKTSYAKRNISKKPNQKAILMHREIMHVDKGFLIDHKDLNGLNNQKNNLRLTNNSQNCANRRKNKNNKSGYKGVYWHKTNKKYHAQIGVNSKVIHLGFFDKKKDAAREYQIAVQNYFGEYGRII